MAEDTWLKRVARPKVTRWVYAALALVVVLVAAVDGGVVLWVGAVVFAVSALTRHVLYRRFMRAAPDE
ncbi:hypothetical protein [Cellulomonas sp. PhB150]|uniref:hypothetical protein n=1 Tax=Cellulomonas sp. PhB150 TaxID=2485188 RepID=UPI000F4776AC|nr:hypothetical protein [Cellulomonas sp. PhB150]ROS27995.1 hypothetical protein EDF34_1791 [Cellulomonas sp. PhB150]